MRRILAAMQPYFLPYGGYFSLLASADLVVFLDEDQFVSRRWMNRSLVNLDSGEGWLTIPVAVGGGRPPINKVQPAINVKDYEKVLRQFTFVTQNSQIGQALDLDDLCKSTTSLSELNITLTSSLYTELTGRQLEYCKYSEIKNALPPFRDFQERAAHICLEMGFDVYLNASGGKHLYEASVFENLGIELEFMKPYVEEQSDRLSIVSQPSITHARTKIIASAIASGNYRGSEKAID